MISTAASLSKPGVESGLSSGVVGQGSCCDPRAWKTARVHEAAIDQERISDYADDYPETLAGWWIERARPPSGTGGRIWRPTTAFVIAFTSDIAGHTESLRNQLIEHERLRAIRMRFTYRHLLDLAEQVPSILGREMEGVTGWGPDTKRNVVTVKVLPERLDAVESFLMDTNPDDVRVGPGLRAVATVQPGPVM
jgi:hypothetical protein